MLCLFFPSFRAGPFFLLLLCLPTNSRGFGVHSKAAPSLLGGTTMACLRTQVARPAVHKPPEGLHGRRMGFAGGVITRPYPRKVCRLDSN